LSANPRIPGFGLIDQSSLQAKNVEVTDECDTIIAIAAARGPPSATINLFESS
jgi:hypothetical protein